MNEFQKFALDAEWRLFDIDNFQTIVSYQNNLQSFDFEYPAGTLPYLGGYSSSKSIRNRSFYASSFIKHRFDLWDDHLEIQMKSDVTNEALNYNFRENIVGIGISERPVSKQLTSFNFVPGIKSVINSIDEIELELSSGMAYYHNNLQKSTGFLPFATIQANWYPYKYSFLRSVRVYANYAKSASSTDLFFNSLAHNSLSINSSDYLRYHENNDLFNTSSLSFEFHENMNLGVNLGLLGNIVYLGLDYGRSSNRGLVFPVLSESNVWELKNTVDMNEDTYKADLRLSWYTRNLRVSNSIQWSKNVPTVTAVKNTDTPTLPFDGFGNVNAQMIAGQKQVQYSVLRSREILREEKLLVKMGFR